MPNTYVALRTETVAVATPSVTFDLTGISGYTDLVMVMQARTDTTFNVDYAVVRLNNDATSLYSRTEVFGDGATAGSFRGSNFLIGVASTAQGGNTQIKTMNVLQFMNYSNTTTNKTVLYRQSGAEIIALAGVGLYRSTSPITQITLTPFYGSWQAGSTFSLYGIANADQGAAKATGGMITEDSEYYYHTFGASGAFIPKQSLTCDVLVVAGGGGGGAGQAGNHYGGGAGAGGLRSYNLQSLTTQNYTITIGAGGAGGLGGASNRGTNGNASAFTGLTGTAGGGGGGSNTLTGNAGGSGGGGGGSASSNPVGGAASPSGEGNAGGQGLTSYRAGGGGGAGAIGFNGGSPTAGLGGNGGIGSTSSLLNAFGAATGTGQLSSGSYYYAGGGGGTPADVSTGGGLGGLGGGGNGSLDDSINGSGRGLASTGGGGGGGSVGNAGANLFTTGGSGGSGIVIVRYSK